MEQAALHFQFDGIPVQCKPFGNGHINSSFLVTTDSGARYMLQSVNGAIFKDIPGLMDNIIAVCQHIAKKNPDPRGTLHFVPADTGAYWYLDENSIYWRSYRFVENSITFEPPFGPEEFRRSGIAFGTFQNQLADFPAETLCESIPRFHDTPDRFRQFREKIDADPCGRVKDVQPEIDFLLSREEDGGRLQRMKDAGALPLRVTHNDTKLNNALYDAETKEPICVIDLDTVMPGLSALDFGDAIRFGASTAAEDERDLSKVHFDIRMFEAFAGGFIPACPNLTEKEFEVLPLGAWTITLENAARFLADYLDGDHYYSTSRPGQNLDRARTQIRMVEEMEQQMEQLEQVIRNVRQTSRS